MFTGIIQHVGTVRQVHPRGTGARFRIDVGPLADGLSLGDSMAVNGACLTAALIEGREAEFDAVAETVSRTTLARLRPGAKVNLEPALAADGRFDGHIVQGHVDGRATVAAVTKGDAWTIRFAADAELLAQLVPKGSIAVDGVSLTLADVSADGFSVAVIPTTLAETTLASLKPGDAVNIELDILGKYVRRTIRQLLAEPAGRPGGLTLESLRDAGFA